MRMNIRLTFGRALLAAVMGCAGVAGCSSSQNVARTGGDAIARDVRGIPIFRGADGAPVAWEQLVAEAVQADVLLVGENHGHPVGLPWAAALWEDVSGRAPGAALSMEFFERDDQSRLDDYLKGVTDEATFLKRTERGRGNYPPSHRAMVERAKALERSVIAANTPWEIVRFLRGKDYDALRALTPEQARLFRVPDAPPEGRYRADYDKLMGKIVGPDHSATVTIGRPDGAGGAGAMSETRRQARLDASFRAQHLWDWTMGESVARAVDAGNRPLLHVIGRFHTDYFGGTPQAVMKLRPGTRMIVVSVVDAASTQWREEDRGRADFVVYVGEGAEEGRRIPLADHV